jgi:16S rRNA (guanine1207-N2)-methyltransferase
MSKPNRDVDHYFSAEPKSQDRFGLIKAHLCGHKFEFLTSSSVFSKTRVDTGTQLLIESMVLPQKGCVLDIGCGYGVVGIVAGTLGKSLRIMMSDVNMRAVRLARRNVMMNRVFNAEVRYGYCYEPVGDLRFDAILSNPPVSAGMDTVKAIITGAPTVMAAGGSFQMVIRSKIGAKALPELFEATFGNVCVLARESGFRVLMGKLS